jgi:PAS domain S-box-containing protein
MKRKFDADPQMGIILNSIADGVVTIDHEKNITSFNKSAEKITGIRQDQAIAKKCFDVLRTSICQNSCTMEKAIKKAKPIIVLPITIINHHGNIVPISITAAALKNNQGKVIGGVETFRDLSDLAEMRKELTKQYTFHDIIGKSQAIQQLFAMLPDIAESDSSVLLQGASGTGKELFARAIHNISNRKAGPYITVNCGALPDPLLESELFGYVRGAFTDAKQDKPGRFARAEGGTLFLDEIGELPLALQVKLLRVLQDGEYEPLGATQGLKANVRIIAATNHDLSKLLSDGRFREDLYYRLNIIKLNLPPLSQRKEDIPLLVDHFIHRFNMKKGKAIAVASRQVMQFFMNYDFPGNIRELENMIEYAFVLCRGSIITFDHLPQEIKNKFPIKKTIQYQGALPLKNAEAEIILNILTKHKGNRAKTAAELGIDKSTLWRKMKKLNITF